MLRACAAFLLLSSICAGIPYQTQAQASRDRIAESAQWRVGGFIGLARSSPVSSLLGVTPGRDHYFIGLQALTEVLRAGPLTLSYGAQLLPVVAITGRTPPEGYRGLTRPDGRLPGPDVAYAFGVVPFGLEVGVHPFRSIVVYGASAAGGLVFRRPFPVPEASRINFTLEYGGGLLILVGRGRWIQLGYKYHHLSNAYTARMNPGLDGHVFYVGYQVSIRLPR
ncbi:MAG TPA: acyloxyacyl hydrolase [Rhodothermales bacterium]|nr:acyloxyacyl hydrolase [Rhodothermales bacterium]